MAESFRDNPGRILRVTVDPGAADLEARLLALVRDIVPSWADAREVRVAPVHGGITNRLFRLFSGRRPELLVRIYGDNTEVVIDRESENRLFAELSRQGFAPAYHGRFENGRVEGWLEGYRALTPGELGQPGLRRLIARELRVLHDLWVPETGSRLWSTLTGWMARARAVEFTGSRATAREALRLDHYTTILARLQDLEQELLSSASGRPGRVAAFRSVVAHNDLLAGNVLTNADRSRVRFIDYEYGAPAPAAFDVANHFCEYAGFDSDFEAGFPSRADRDDFIAHYLGREATSEAVSDFSRVVEFYVLPDHLWWGTWSVVQAHYSPIDFDYLEYARLRLAGFDLHLARLGFDLG